MNRTFTQVELFVAMVIGCAACTSAPQVPPPDVESARTLIPTRETTLQLTPYPVPYLVTTRDGQELQFRNIMFEANEYVAFHTESVPQGIPIVSGVEISFDYISQVDFGNPAPDWDSTPQVVSSPEPLLNPAGELILPDSPLGTGSWPVTIILTDGSSIETSLGFKAHHKIHLTGNSNYGFLDISLADIQKLVIERTAAPRLIPTQPSGDDPISIETVNGEVVSITYPRLFTTCMYDVYCCRGEDLTLLPLEGKDILFDDVSSVEFSDQLALVIFQDGRTLESKLRTSIDCPGTGWRLRGKAALGDFELPLALIKKIVH
jgi:hypothetical protein